MPGFDAAATFVKVLDLLAKHGTKLSDVVADLPRTHVVHEQVVTPWDQKGAVMRTLMEQSKDREVVLVDGVKVVHPDGWALALPDPEEPVTHIWAEGDIRRRRPTPRRGVRPAHPPDGPLRSAGLTLDVSVRSRAGARASAVSAPRVIG